MKRWIPVVVLSTTVLVVAVAAGGETPKDGASERSDGAAAGNPSGPRFLVNGANSSWSPDGTRIVFSERSNGGGLKILELKTGKVTEFLPSGKDPAWSPKAGRWIAYVETNGRPEEIWLVEPSGRNPKKIADGGYPTWAADGKTLFFQSRTQAKLMAIQVEVKDAKATEVLGTTWLYPAVSPDGKLAAFRVGDQAVVVDCKTGKTVRTWPLPGARGFLPGWSPDGKHVGFGGYGQTMGLWILNVQSGRAVRVPTNGFTRPAWSPDGSKLSFDLRAGSEAVWIMETKDLASLKPVDRPDPALATKPLQPTPAVPSPATPAAPPEGSASPPSVLRLKPDPPAAPIAVQTRVTLKGHTSRVESVAFSPDGKTLVSAGRDRTIKLWDVATGQLQRTLEGHTGRVHSVAFSPDGKTLASGGSDDTVKLWDAKTGEERLTLTGHADLVTSLAFSPDGKTLASASEDRAIKLWNVATGEEQRTLTGHAYGVASVAFSPDGKTLVSGSEDATVKLWNVETGQPRMTLTGHAGWLTCVSFSPDGKVLSSSSNDGNIKLWDAETGRLRASLAGHSLSVASIAFSPDGKTLATASKDRTVKLWDVATGKPRATLEGHTGWLCSVAFSPDKKTLASASSDTTIRLWDVTIKELPVAKVTVEPPPTQPTPPATAPGEDYALLLNGRDSYVQIPGLRYDGTHPITLEALVTPISENPTNLPGVPHLRGRVGTVIGDKESGGINLAVTPDGFECQVRGSTGYVTARCQQAPFGQGRLHVASVFDTKVIRVYVNGKLAAVAAFPARFQRSQFEFLIGADPDRTQRTEARFKGVIDEVRISKTARYAKNFKPETKFKPDADTLGLYHFDEGQGLTVGDASIHGRHGRIHGAQWVKAGGSSPSVVAAPDPGIIATKFAATLFGHADSLEQAVFSPDGKTLASAGLDRTIKLWDTETGRERATLEGHGDRIPSLAFAPDGRTLASGSWDRTIKLWDMATGQVRATLVGHTGNVVPVAFSPDGRSLASGSWDRTIKLWDVATGQVRNTLTGHAERVRWLAYSPDGKTLVSGSWDRTVRLWDLETGQPRATLKGHSAQVNGVAFSPDGKTVASGSENGTIKLWDAVNGQQRATIIGHPKGVSIVAFSPDGKTLASASADSTVRFWDPATGHPQATLGGHNGNVRCVAFAPDGTMLASASWDNTVKLWKLPITPSTKSPTDSPPTPSETAAAEFPVTFQIGTGEVRCVVLLSDGKTLASAGPQPAITLRDAITGEVQATLTGHTSKVWALAVSPDGKTLASAARDIKLWDVETRQERATLEGHTGEIRRLAFSPDGKTLASACRDDTVKLWDMASAAERLIFAGHAGGVYAVAFSPDGKTVASAGSGTVIRLWDARTGKELATLEGHSARIRAVAFSPDGKTLASCDEGGGAKLWDVEKGKERTSLTGHTAKLYYVAFSPDGKTLASVGNDQTIKLWNVVSGKEAATLYGHTGGLLFVTFSPDGKTAASSGKDGTIRLWDLAAVEKMAARYDLPDGGVDELTRFLEGVQKFRPATFTEFGVHQNRAAAVGRAAAAKILKLEKDESSKAYKAAALVILKHRVATMAEAEPEMQRQTLDDLKTHLAARVEKGLTLEDTLLATSAARDLESGRSGELAAEAYRDFAKLFAQSKDERLAALSKKFEGATRRYGLLGNEVKLTGTKMDGTAFDWTAYRGKVVLVDFSDTQSLAWRSELPNVRKNYQLLHDRGFEVVWVSSDSDRRSLEQFIEAEEPAWGVTLHEKETPGEHPLAAYYGVMSFPTALLVDRQGKVVSLHARGKELDEKLETLLGPPVAPKGKLTYIDLQPQANRKLTETWSGGPGNDLSELPRGEQTLGGVKFKIGDGLIQLASRQRPNAPENVAGIEVNQTAARLYILQSMEWGAENVPEGAFVGRYEIHYEDQSAEKIYIVKGQDVRDWWDGLHSKPVSLGKVVWVGRNPAVKRGNRNLRLYLCAWENPHAGKKVTSISFISTNTTTASPFCVAITAEAVADVAGGR